MFKHTPTTSAITFPTTFLTYTTSTETWKQAQIEINRFPTSGNKGKLRNRPLVTDKTQPQRWQEREELEDNTQHTTYT